MRTKYILRGLFVFILIIGSRFISSNSELPQDKDFEISFKLGMEYIEGELYEEALPVFKELLAKDEFNANVNYLLGYCYYNIPTLRTEAIPYLENSLNDIGGDYRPNDYTEVRAPAIAYYYLAEIFFINNDFNEAISNYENLKLLLDYADVNLIEYSKTDLITLIDKKMENCNTGILLSENPVNVEFIDVPLLDHIEFSSYSGRMYNEIWYSKKEITESSKSSSDVFMLVKKENKWSKVEKLSGDINSNSDDIFCCLALDDQLLLISSDRGEKNDFDIYYSRKKGKKWSESQNNLNINSISNETFASYTSDGNTIYFVSDRKGGQGAKDIYKSEKQSDGSWGEAQNLGESINTQFDEESPFLAEDGKTLYFSSQGHNNMGGYDIFFSILQDGEWSTPKNIGYPINTTLDDLYFSIDSNKIALYSSGRRDKPGNFYIFMMKYQDEEGAAAVETYHDVSEPEPTETNVDNGAIVAVAAAVAIEGSQPAVDSIQTTDPHVETHHDVSEPETIETNVGEGVAAVVAVETYHDVSEPETTETNVGAGVAAAVAVTAAVAEEDTAAVVVSHSGVTESEPEPVTESEPDPVSEPDPQPTVVIVDENIQDPVIKKQEVILFEEEVVEEIIEVAEMPDNDPVELAEGDYYYTVQIGAGNMKVQYFDKISEKTVCFSSDGLARFYVGAFTTLNEAVSYRNELIMLGYSDAWTPKIDEVRCKDFDLNYLLNLPDQVPSRNVSSGKYTVQVGAGNMKISHFRKLQRIKVCKGSDGLNRFIIGRFDELHEAEKARSAVVNLGFYDAWIPEVDANRCGD